MARTLYVSTRGNDRSTGSYDKPFATWQKAVDTARAGDTIVIAAGTYHTTDSLGHGLKISGKSGTASAPITIKGIGGLAILDNSSDTSNWGSCTLSMDRSDHWVFKNLGFAGAIQNSRGAWAVGAQVTDSSDNVFRKCEFFNNQGPGLLIHGASGGNAVIDSKAHDNYDPLSKRAGGNADGIDFSYIAAGHSGNRIVNAQVWNNSDDGIDLYGSNSVITVTGSRAWHNGYKPGTDQPSGGDGDGLKLGMSSSTAATHRVENNIAFDNKLHGFDSNGARAPLRLTGNSAYENGYSNYYMDDGVRHILTGNVSRDPGVKDFLGDTITSGNSWEAPRGTPATPEDLKTPEAPARDGGSVLHGTDGDDTIVGGAGGESIYGHAGNDILDSRGGPDRLIGGAGADTFRWKSIGDIGVRRGDPDTIHDFHPSEGDRNDLRAIDADTGARGDQAFDFIGGRALHGEAGELRYDAKTMLLVGDIDGDAVPDFKLAFAQPVQIEQSDLFL